MSEKVFMLNDETVVHPQTVFEVNLFHNTSFREIIESQVDYENKRYIESNIMDKIILDDIVEECIVFMSDYHNKVTDNGANTEQIKAELINKLISVPL